MLLPLAAPGGQTRSRAAVPSAVPVLSCGVVLDPALDGLEELFVSQQNAEVSRDGERWSVRDLPGSKNGTRLNFTPIPREERRPLRSGDIVGVGRSLLVFRER